ncbi:gliding motility-associated C-terminal domain-containing protein [Pinibacter soli]|uniref:Gliding motility-associated C-terminal domain-containing protein n=1 Tax=Pinibacter soli TaxID=3044211 RepID=A0ABT6RFQ9_9BACT|nr:gliding motility-associated C-terminal domain-containing protein [Pinibacter soli]MDI3321385.1 gliding motility-associated C-terminal domain-containing protein [Pinibacter soli]
MKQIIITLTLFLFYNVIFAQSNLNNLSFETGNTTKWVFSAGDVTLGQCCSLVPVQPTKGISVIDKTTGLKDVNITALTAYPIDNYNKSRYSLRLGFDSVYATGDSTIPSHDPHGVYRASNSFTVDPAQPLLMVDYAGVLGASAPHDCKQQPYFSIKLKDNKGVELACSTVDMHVPSENCLNPLFYVDYINDTMPFPKGDGVVWNEKSFFLSYTGWKVLAFDLRQYTGQTITLEVTASACVANAHKGYVYFDADCYPFAPLSINVDGTDIAPDNTGIIQVNKPFCKQMSTHTLVAPDLFQSYEWYSTGNPGTPVSTNRKLEVVQGNYTLKMYPFGYLNASTCSNITTLQVNVSSRVQTITADFKSIVSGCIGSEVSFTNYTTAGTYNDKNTLTYLWDFGDGSTITAESPKHTYTNPKDAYTVRLIALSDAGCADTVLKSITIKDTTKASLSDSLYFCQEANFTPLPMPTAANTKWYSNKTFYLGTTPPTIYKLMAGVNEYQFTYTDPGKCESRQANYYVQIKPSPGAGTVKQDQILCGIGKPNLLEEYSASSGGSLLQWQSSIDKINFTAIPGATDKTYQPGELGATTYFRRAVTANNSCSSTSNIVTVTMQPQINAGTIGSSQVITAGSGTIAPLTETAPPSGGNGSYYYGWQSSTDNVNFTDIAGAYDISFTPMATPGVMYYRHVVSSGSCPAAYSNSVSIEVKGVSSTPLTAGSIAASQTICVGSVPNTLVSVSTAAGGTGSLTYQWQSSADNNIFTNITGALNTVYTPNALSTTTYYRRRVTDATTTMYSNTVTITVLPQVNAGAIGNSQVTAPGGAVSALTETTAASGGGNYRYQWQSSVDNISFTNIAGATSISFTPPATPSIIYYRRVVSSGSCPAAYSNSVSIEVKGMSSTPLTGGSIAASQTICAGSVPDALVSLNTAVGGTGSLKYQWQLSTDNINFINISGANTTDYSPLALSVTTYYRRKVADAATTVYSNIVTITVLPQINAGIIGNSQVIASGGTISALTETTAASGGGNYGYQWQSCTDNINFTDIAGAANVSFTPPVMPGIIYYRRAVSSGSCPVAYSNSVNIEVKDISATPLIGGFIAASQTVCAGSIPNALLSVIAAAGGTGSLSYQWQLSNDNINFINISGANNTDYSPLALNVTTYYRRKVADAATTLYSDTATITVLPQINAGAIGNSQVVVAGGTVTALTEETAASGDGNYGYQWQSSADNINFTDIAGATTNSFTPVATPGIMFYRLMVSTDLGCPAAQTNSVSIEVKDAVVAALTAGKIAASQTTCSNFTPNALQSVSVATGGSGSYYYQWQSSMDNINFINIAGAINTMYAPNKLSTTTYYRRGVTDATTTEYSDTITITVLPLAPIPVANDMEVCMGDNMNRLNAIGTNVQWYDSTGKLLGGAPEITTEKAAFYVYYGTSKSAAGCESDKVRVTAIVKAKPQLILVGKTEPTCFGYIKGSFEVKAADDNVGQYWELISGLRQSSGVFASLSEGIYTVRVTGENGCSSDLDVVLSSLESRCDIEMPTAFTPNFDGKNDVFKPVRCGKMAAYNLQIFNRWGARIFESNNPANGWNGYFNGRPANSATYVWVIKYKKENDSQPIILKGTVVLIQ